MKRIAAIALLLAGLFSVAAPAQAKLVSTCVQKTLPAGLHVQVGLCR